MLAEMVTAGEVQETQLKPHQKRINYALAATLLAQNVSFDEIAKRVGAKNGNCLKAGLARKGVTQRVIRNVPAAIEGNTSLTARVAQQASEHLRDIIGDRLGAQLTKLTAKKPGRLASKGMGEAALLKTMAETHKTLYGGAEAINVVFGVGVVQDAGDPQPIEVQAEVVKSPENP